MDDLKKLADALPSIEFERLPAATILRIRKQADADGLDIVGFAWRVEAEAERAIVAKLSALASVAAAQRVPEGWGPTECAAWIRNNYQDHPNVDGLLHAMLAAAPPSPAAQQAAEPIAGWRCFHCDEAFNDSEAAELHFGKSEHDKPACQFDIAHIRWMEAQHRRNVDDDSEALRTVGGLVSEHERLRRLAEEQGYARALADVQKHPADVGLVAAEPPTDQARKGG